MDNFLLNDEKVLVVGGCTVRSLPAGKSLALEGGSLSPPLCLCIAGQVFYLSTWGMLKDAFK